MPRLVPLLPVRFCEKIVSPCSWFNVSSENQYILKQNILYLFNPDHDLALANGDAHFNAPESAKTFSLDAAWLAAWFAKEGYVLCNSSILETYQSIYQQLEMKTICVAPKDLKNLKIEKIVSWGWNAAICEQLRHLGIDEQLLPTETQLNNIRELSHRKTASEAMQFLTNHFINASLFPTSARCLTDVVGIESYLSENQNIVLKSPWSGSGKGLRWCRRTLSNSDVGWCRHILEKQGCIMGEPAFDVVQNFAMEFYCDETVSFSGYSLFKTENGCYRGNMLVSNAIIEQTLAQWISPSDLFCIKKHLMDFFYRKFLGKYCGYLGVDMFVYQENNEIKIHPVVEINLRMTMGLLSRILYDQYIDDKSIGWLQMDYEPKNGIALEKQSKNMIINPLKISNTRIEHGFFPLFPVSEHTKYQIWAKIEKR